MTRACQWCNRYLGEKCSRCGSFNLKILDPLDARARTFLFFLCECGFGFKPGEGGITTGACDDCRERETAKLKEQRDANAG